MGRLFAGAWVLLAAGPAFAVPLIEEGIFKLELGGYARALGGVQQPRLVIDPDLSADLAAPLGLHSGIVRFQWLASVTEHVSLEVHNRFSWQLQSSAGLGGGAQVGLGVSRVPQRLVDTRSVLVQDPNGNFVLQHDIDRFALRLYFDAVDITLGRQAITWGNSNIFLVADLWTNFSPFELDQSQKPGIDAARALTQFGDDVELEVVVAGRQSFDDLVEDRGDWQYLSVGARATFYLSFGDVYAAVAKHWDLAMLHAGVSATFDVFKLRGELTQAYDARRGRFDLPRATVGLDFFGPDLTVTLEGHFNGVGAKNPSDYVTDERSTEAFARGETYLLGRYYVGTAVVYRPWELITIGATLLGNVGDASLMISGFATYSPSENLELTLGAFSGLGEAPRLSGQGLAVRGEYGTYGDLFYFQIASFF